MSDFVDLQAKKDSSLWNESSKHLSPNVSILDQESEDSSEKDLYSDEDTSDSDGIKKDGSCCKNLVKQTSKSFAENPFEFPKQQEGDKNIDPDVMQFTASKSLLNPNLRNKSIDPDVMQFTASQSLLNPNFQRSLSPNDFSTINGSGPLQLSPHQATFQRASTPQARRQNLSFAEAINETMDELSSYLAESQNSFDDIDPEDLEQMVTAIEILTESLNELSMADDFNQTALPLIIEAEAAADNYKKCLELWREMCSNLMITD
uniref:Uncharacterized protein n=1 Tax=Panagrolaimus sp. ES5 TaxID=591445 RepID=A0AC34G5W9_9BILA